MIIVRAPATKKALCKPQRTWKTDTTITSSDGVTVRKDDIAIKENPSDVISKCYSIQEAKTLLSQLQEALEIHKKHFK